MLSKIVTFTELLAEIVDVKVRSLAMKQWRPLKEENPLLKYQDRLVTFSKIKKEIKKEMELSKVSRQICDIVDNYFTHKLQNDSEIDKAMRVSSREELSMLSRTELADWVLKYYEEANMDVLTGLANRRQFQKHIEDCNKNQNRNLLMAIDISGFREVNNMLGHEVGDKALKTVADEIKSRLASEREKLQDYDSFHSTVYRIGGDEFAVILDPAPVSIESFKRLIERLADIRVRLTDKSVPRVYDFQESDESIAKREDCATLTGVTISLRIGAQASTHISYKTCDMLERLYRTARKHVHLYSKYYYSELFARCGMGSTTAKFLQNQFEKGYVFYVCQDLEENAHTTCLCKNTSYAIKSYPCQNCDGEDFKMLHDSVRQALKTVGRHIVDGF